MPRWGRLALLVLPFAGIAFVAWRILPAPKPDAATATPGPSAGLDDDGDPLPAFAVRRFGSARLRPGDGPVALSPDGTKVYSGHGDGLVRVWDVATGHVERTIVAHPDYVPLRPRTLRETWYRAVNRPPAGPDRVGGLVVSPDGSVIATCASGSIRVFDAATGARRADWTASGLACVYGFSADGAHLLLHDRGVCLWSFDGESPRPLDVGSADRSGPVTVSADGRSALSVQYDDQDRGRASLIECDTGAVSVLPESDLWWLSPSPTAPRRLAGIRAVREDAASEADDDDTPRPRRLRLCVRSPDDARPTLDVECPQGAFGGLTWTADGSALVAATATGLLRVDAVTGAVRTLRDGRWQFAGAATRANRVLAVHDGALRVLDLDTGAETPQTRPGDAVTAFAWSPVAPVLALGRGDGTVVVARPGDGAVTYGPVDGGFGWDGSLQFDATGTALGIESVAPETSVLDLSAPGRSGAPDRRTYRRATDQWNGSTVVDGAPVRWVCGDGRPVELVRDADGTRVALEGAAGRVTPTFSGDGLSAFGFTGPRGIAVWDMRTGKRTADLPFEGGSCVSAISMDGRRVACRLGDDVTVFDVAAPDAPVVLAASVFPGFPAPLAVSPDGRLLAAGDDRGLVHVVSVPLRRCVATFEGHLGAVRRIEFSCDGRFVASLGEDRTVVVWDVETAVRAGTTAPR